MQTNNGKSPEKSSLNSFDLNQSLLFRALKEVRTEIKGEVNTYYAAKRYGNNPEDHPGERILQFVRFGNIPEVIKGVVEKNPDLISNRGKKKSETSAA